MHSKLCRSKDEEKGIRHLHGSKENREEGEEDSCYRDGPPLEMSFNSCRYPERAVLKDRKRRNVREMKMCASTDDYDSDSEICDDAL